MKLSTRGFERPNLLPCSNLPASALCQLESHRRELPVTFNGKHDERKPITMLAKTVRQGQGRRKILVILQKCRDCSSWNRQRITHGWQAVESTLSRTTFGPMRGAVSRADMVASRRHASRVALMLWCMECELTRVEARLSLRVQGLENASRKPEQNTWKGQARDDCYVSKPPVGKVGGSPRGRKVIACKDLI
jgi:hypothetical protein